MAAAVTQEQARAAGALEVAGITVSYGSQEPVVHDVTLEVPAGKVVALLGANGAGKTTILRAITGLLGEHGGRVVSGAVRLDGRDLTREGAAARVRAGMAQVMEGRRVFAELSVDDNLRAGAITRKDRRAIAADADAVYERFPDLVGRKSDKAGYLSGGQQQMLAIGRALMTRPRVLLLDEPSLGLAPRLVEQVGEIVTEINREGTTVVVIEQNVALALKLSDLAYVLETGRVVASGPSAELAADDRVRQAYLGGHVGG
jgi:branched-chain amino acid transport system ATP-binding protein